jgi:glycosyltransferase involved in cell wall biosynthesis
MYTLYILKRNIEDIFIFPFILLGRLISILKPLEKEYKIFYLFPFYHVGGAEKVHLQIAQSTGGTDSIIFFTRRSHNEGYLKDFKVTQCTIKDISCYTDNKWLYFLNLIFRGIVSGYVNNQKTRATIFNGQCNFGYKISPWITKRSKQIELIHSFNSFSYIRIPFLAFIDTTVMISKRRINDHLDLYRKFNIPKKYDTKIKFISNAIDLPKSLISKPERPFTILFVGRGTSEKRPHIFTMIAKKLHSNQSFSFQMVGDVSESINTSAYPYIKFWGNVTDPIIIASIYQNAHVLIIPSETEGFPMVMIEAMANGLAILATPVGDIPYHLKNGINGFLFSSIDDEEIIIGEAVTYIKELVNDERLFSEINNCNALYARKNFDIKDFAISYQKLLR